MEDVVNVEEEDVVNVEKEDVVNVEEDDGYCDEVNKRRRMENESAAWSRESCTQLANWLMI